MRDMGRAGSAGGERPVVTWTPAMPGFAATLIVSAFVFVLGTVMALAAVVYLVVGGVRRRWTPWSWVAVGSLVAYALYWLLLVLHRVF